MKPQEIKRNWASAAESIYEETSKRLTKDGRFEGCIAEFSTAILLKIGFKEGHI